MSDIYREATILIRYKTDKSKLEGPELGQAVQAHEQVTKAVERRAAAEREAGSVSRAAAEESITSAKARASGYREASQAAAQLTAKEIEVGKAIRLTAQQEEERWRKQTARAMGVNAKSVTHEQINQFLEGRHGGYGKGMGIIRDARRDADQYEKLSETEKDTDKAAKKIEASWEQAGRGALQYTRSLAYVATSAGATSQKIVQDLILVEAGSQFISGTANLARFSKEFGKLGIGVAGVGVVLGAGALAWDSYTKELEDNEKQIANTIKAHRAQAEAIRDSQKAVESIQNRGRSQLTDANSSPSERARAQESELRDIREKRGERDTELQRRADARRASLAEEAAATQQARKWPSNRAEAIDQFGYPRGERAFLQDKFGMRSLLTPHKEFMAKAESAHSSAEQNRTQGQRLTELSIEDATREKQILDDQRRAKITEIEEKRDRQLEGLRQAESNMTDMERGFRQHTDKMFEMRGAAFRKQTPAGLPSAFGGFGDIAGASAFNSMRNASPDDVRQSPINSQAAIDVSRVNSEADKAVKNVIELLTKLNTNLENFKGQVNRAHPE